MTFLAEKGVCTGCGACAFICPKQCILMKSNEMGAIYPEIDHTDCISCNRCQKVCPIISPVVRNSPNHAYAAWSCDDEERSTSASGGIASEIYKHSINEGWKIVGAVQQKDFSVSLQLSDNRESIALFKNSKYVFSTAYSLFPQIKVELKKGNSITIIGLPCQIAALRKLFPNQDKLFLVDLVCHGTTPHDYLIQHIHALEKEYGKKAVLMSFRDPHTYTYTYTFTLYDAEGNRFCERKIEKGDAYQVGYHKKITYRENCYHCPFANSRRMGDLTIADYHGLGKSAPCSFSSRDVSLILSNSEKGEALIQELVEKNKITVYERPLEEPIQGEIQLRHPSIKTADRRDFERLYKGDFTQAMAIVLRNRQRRLRIEEAKQKIKKCVKKIIYLIARK